jgi:hypothetical protein
MVIGPVARSVQFPAVASPPLSFVTVFTNVRSGGMSSFVIEHVAASPTASVIVFPVTSAPPFFTQLYVVPFVYPGKLPVSLKL